MRKEGRLHRVALEATPPADLADRLDLRAQLAFSREGTHSGTFS